MEDKNSKKKRGLDVISDHIVYNWTTRTVITDLGEYGNFVCSFDMHGAIMRAYSNEYEGKGDTQAEIAMRFDFPHAKAVAKYMRYHGMTKSMPGQTDIEFAEGLDPKDAVEENIQALKRKVVKDTERKKWRQVQLWADKWLNFNHTVLKPLENHIAENLPKYKPIKADIQARTDAEFAAVVGISDWHFMSLVYDKDGNVIYDRKIARRHIKRHAAILAEKMLRYGRPEVIYIPLGNDNLSIDSPTNTTTRGTPQQVDGEYPICIDEYIDINMEYIEYFAQIANVEVAVIAGNHDEQTSMLLRVMIERLYKDREDVNVQRSYHPRMYYRYGKNCLMFTHGHHKGNKKMKRDIHQIIMGEAKFHKINMNQVDNYLIFTGHDHVGSYEDLNGNVQYFIMPSLKVTDDFWHLNMGYMGRAMESALFIIDKNLGRDAIVYSR
jgi:hypothetical protein